MATNNENNHRNVTPPSQQGSNATNGGGTPIFAQVLTIAAGAKTNSPTASVSGEKPIFRSYPHN